MVESIGGADCRTQGASSAEPLEFTFTPGLCKAGNRKPRAQDQDYLLPGRLPELRPRDWQLFHTSKDQSGYRSLLSAVLAGPRKLVEKAEAARREAALKSLARERMRCVQALFVGIRSNYLSRGAALDAWDRLETIDAQEGKWDKAPVADHPERVQHYRNLFELIMAWIRTQSVGTHKHRLPGQVETTRFHRLCERVRGGRVSPEQLSIAGQLRRTDPQLRRANPELNCLYGGIWV